MAPSVQDRLEALEAWCADVAERAAEARDDMARNNLVWSRGTMALMEAIAGPRDRSQDRAGVLAATTHAAKLSGKRVSWRGHPQVHLVVQLPEDWPPGEAVDAEIVVTRTGRRWSY